MSAGGGDTQGASHGGVIELAPDAGTKTLVHELAHELLHHTDRPAAGCSDADSLSHVTAETEAESIAFVVCAYLGIPGLNSPNYIALVGADKEKIRLSLERIQRTARQIIEAIDPALDKDQA